MDEILWEPTQYAIFRRMDGNVITGFSIRTLLAVVLGLLIGALLFVGVSQVTHTVERPIGYAQAAEQQQYFTDMAACVRYVEQKKTIPQDKWELELGAIRKYTLGAYAEDEIEAMAKAGASLGMTKDTTAIQAQAFAPTTEQSAECVLGPLERAMVALTPALFAGIFFFDHKGICLAREMGAFALWGKSQKRYYHS